MSREYEIIIVGCGPSGNTLAFQLARQGRRVLLLEKEMLPRRKVCGGGLSRKAILELPYSVRPVYEQTIESILLTHGDGRVLLKPLEGAGALVRRDALDDFMTQRALQAGAELEQGCRFESYTCSPQGIDVRTDKGVFRSRILVGADGVYSTVRKQLLPDKRVKTAPAVEALVYPKSSGPRALGQQAWFDLGAIRGGYGWIFPKRDHFSVGLYRFVRRRDNVDMRSLLIKMVRGNPLLRDHHQMEIKASSVPLQPVSAELARDNVVLLGDAAGLPEAFYGEGIYHAVRSANIAAECITATLAGEASLSEYNRKLFSLKLYSFSSRVNAGVFYRLPAWATDAMLRNALVNELFGRLVTGKISPLQCFFLTAGCLPIWVWMPNQPTRPLEAVLQA